MAKIGNCLRIERPPGENLIVHDNIGSLYREQQNTPPSRART